MPYYMRYITDDEMSLTIDALQQGLAQINPAFALRPDSVEVNMGELWFEGDFLGEVELNTAEEDIFQEDIEEFKELVAFSKSEHKPLVLSLLENARQMVAVSAVWEGDDPEPVMEKLDLLWDWLFERHHGILQADAEGFYDSHELILEMKLNL